MESIAHRQRRPRRSPSLVKQINRAIALGLVIATVVLVWQSVPAQALKRKHDPFIGFSSDLLQGVSCVSSSDCVAVGDYNAGGVGRQTLVESWNGTVWTVVPSPNEAGSNRLQGVSCVSGADCVAVGTYTPPTDVTPQNLIESWDGTSWSIVPSPTEGTFDAESLNSVSCVDSSDCVAVGYYATSDGNDTLIEQWDGSAWTVTSNPASGSLSGVSCPDTGLCLAVGSNNFGPVTEMWNGSGEWTQVGRQFPGSLASVTCVSDTSCTAAGGTTVYSWTGTDWSAMETPSDGIEITSFSGVSCADSAACEVVGDGNNGGSDPNQTVVEWWNGTTWTVETSPNPIDTNVLNGVACADTTDCIAVGQATDVNLVDWWNGSTVSEMASPNDGIFLSPGQGRAGSPITVDGGGAYQPGENVAVTYVTGYSAPQPTTVTICDAVVDNEGLFACSGVVPHSKKRKDPFHTVTALGETSNVAISMSFIIEK